jgi:hypothetical protein
LSFEQLIELGFVGGPLSVSLYYGVRTARFVGRCRRARATVFDAVRNTSDDDNLYRFQFVDSITGEQVTTELISSPERFFQKQRVNILYDPMNLRASVTVDNFLGWFRLWLRTIIPALASLMSLAYFTFGF